MEKRTTDQSLCGGVFGILPLFAVEAQPLRKVSILGLLWKFIWSRSGLSCLHLASFSLLFALQLRVLLLLVALTYGLSLIFAGNSSPCSSREGPGGAHTQQCVHQPAQRQAAHHVDGLDIPGVDSTGLIDTGATGFRRVVPVEHVGEVVGIYKLALSTALEIAPMMACLSALPAVLLKWRGARKGSPGSAEPRPETKPTSPSDSDGKKRPRLTTHLDPR